MSTSSRPHVLVTGGAGYIGSHTAVALHEAGFAPVLMDNLHNSDLQAVDGVRELCGEPVPFHQLDVRDGEGLTALFDSLEHAGTPLQGILHFAAHKAVGESVAKPAMYASNNVGGLGTLLEVADAHNVRNLVFSSSCTVYGEPEHVPVDESAPFQPAESPYGWTKQASERVLTDHAATHPEHRVALLRYFNPIGAHPSAAIGELPLGVPNNLVPFLTQSVAGIRGALTVFGDDYPTADGTGVRDYIHVEDLATAHVAAVDYLHAGGTDLCVNLGTGIGSSVRQILDLAAEVAGRPVPHEVVGRRLGDPAAVYADVTLAEAALGWRAERTLAEIISSAYAWHASTI